MTEFKEVSIDTTPRLKTLTIDQTVQATGIGRNAIDKWIKDENSDFPFFKIGTKHLIPVIALENWFIKVSEERRCFT